MEDCAVVVTPVGLPALVASRVAAAITLSLPFCRTYLSSCSTLLNVSIPCPKSPAKDDEELELEPLLYEDEDEEEDGDLTSTSGC